MEAADVSAWIRSYLWLILAQAMGEPCEEKAAMLCEVAAEFSEHLGVLEHPFQEPVALLSEALQGTDTAKLAAEWNELFSTTVLVPVTEGSYHLTDRGAIMADIAGFYLAFGMQVDSLEGTPDSLWNELNFLAYLAIREKHALETNLDEELAVTRDATKKFLADHLGRWAATFTARLVQTPGIHPVYVEAARLLIDTLALAAEDVGIESLDHLDYLAEASEDEMVCPAACPDVSESDFIQLQC